MGLLSEGAQLYPQQLQIADLLATGRGTYVIEVPRRASKTTSIFLALLGRCSLRPGYKVTYTAQSGVAAYRQFREWATTLDAVNPPDDGDLPPWLRGRPRRTKAQTRQVALFGDELVQTPADPDRRGFRVMLGQVAPGLEFDNGSTFRLIAPKAANFRGAASDVSWIDEAQEVPVEDGADLLAGIRPLQDTRPGAHVIVSGTAGETRAGIFWDLLERGRAGDEAVGILDFAAPPATPWPEIEDVDAAMRLLGQVHPGIGTLTTEQKMRAQWAELPRPQWAREYLSLWPETFSQRAIPVQLWEDARLPRKVPKPAKVAFGLAIKPGGSVAAIVAAWRDGDGVGFVEVVDHRPGTRWVPKRVIELTGRYKGSTVGYDARGEGGATKTEVDRISGGRVVMSEQKWPDLTAGSIQFLRDLERGMLKHFTQQGLDTAVADASRRDSGDVGQWTWSPMEPGRDIVCLDAASRALRNWDRSMDRMSRRPAPRIIVNRPS